MTLVGASLLYGFYNDDKAVLGGIATGYAAFLLALWVYYLKQLDSIISYQ